MVRFYPTFFKIAFSGMDAERAHAIGFAAIKACRQSGVSKALRMLTAPDKSLRTEALGRVFPSPFGLAAGFDKGATGINALTDLGFGHVEVGTVTGQPQSGNPKPRLHRLVRDHAVINRMGFNNDGADQIGPRLASAHADLWHDYKERTRPIVGVNIGKTKVVPVEDAIEDYVHSTRTLAPQADYLAVNVSSPNTPGLRDLQHIDALRPLLSAVVREAEQAARRHVPVLVKIAPDLSDTEVAAIADLAVELELDGIIATNTTIRREGLGLQSSPTDIEECGTGGLSGEPLRKRSLEVLSAVRARVGADMTIISVGGVTSAGDVEERLQRGANLVQGYTAFLYEGPFWAARINRGLKKMRRRRS
ncbi:MULTISPECIES: quinone-dependent dihydroorotate dehydrogenase [Micrococcaceae]|uniref:quinone-dependent dihydroorotate dehydrogenase n=1 Tax=unclassified Kocuria TaxID=2649579 RepID=UPI002101D15E|nr:MULTISPECIES: quinone-dependent dihydroorotate dehydrogenase [unclassified Kocuria]